MTRLEDAPEALAEVWASIDGKLDAFRRERDESMEWDDSRFTGHYIGYMEDAAEMIRRLKARGFIVIPAMVPV